MNNPATRLKKTEILEIFIRWTAGHKYRKWKHSPSQIQYCRFIRTIASNIGDMKLPNHKDITGFPIWRRMIVFTHEKPADQHNYVTYILNMNIWKPAIFKPVSYICQYSSAFVSIDNANFKSKNNEQMNLCQ